MAKKKLNKKLVFVVGSLVILTLFGGAGLLLMRYRLDTERHIRAGEQFMAQGEYRKAADAFGRAVSKKEANLEYQKLYQGALLKIVPETATEATERYQQLMAVLASRARYSRDDQETWREYLSAIAAEARSSDAVGSWKLLSERADAMLRVARPESKCVPLGHLYRGFANARRADSLNESERTGIESDLRSAIDSGALTPAELDMAVGSLARYAVGAFLRARVAGENERSARALESADKFVAEALERAPDGFYSNVAAFELAVAKGAPRPDSATLVPLGERLAAATTKMDDPQCSLEAASVLARGGIATERLVPAVLEATLAKDPNSMPHLRGLALYLRGSDPEKALAQIDRLSGVARPTVGRSAVEYDLYIGEGARLKFDLIYDLMDKAASDEERKQLRTRAVEARNALERAFAGTSDPSLLLRADAKLDLLDRKYAEALIKLNDVLKRGTAVDLEVYLLAAFANMQLREDGRAIEFINRGLEAVPGAVPLVRMRAALEMRAFKFREAAASAQSILNAIPGDPEATQLLAEIKATMSADPVAAAAEGVDVAAQLLSRIQEAADAGDYARARRLIAETAAKKTLDEARLARFAIALEIQAKDFDAAKRLQSEAIAKFPGDPLLQRFGAVLASDDPVQRIAVLVESAYSEPLERTAYTYARVRQTAAQVRNQSVREGRLGQKDASAANAAIADRLDAGAAEWRTKLEAMEKFHPVLLEFDFGDALERKDFAAAEAIAKIAEQSSSDRTQGVVMQARALLVQDKATEAAAVLDRAVAGGLDASIILRALGAALEQSGNIEGALRQYEEAYRRRPTDMNTVRLLVGALIRSGGTQRALEILREARTASGLDEEIGETWIALETQLGDRRLAQRLREARYLSAPSDSRNAAALATMLAMSAPDRGDILTERGDPAYSETQWRAMTSAQRSELLERVRVEWRDRSERIFKDVLKRQPGDVDAANACAMLLRAIGRGEESEAVLASAVKAAGPSLGWRGEVMLGNLQIQAEAEDRARESFGRAIALDPSGNDEALKAIIDQLMRGERFALAIEFLEPLAARSKDKSPLFRLAEAQMRAGQLEKARASFDKAVEGQTREIGAEMLDGAISMAIGDAARAKADAAAARKAYEAALPCFQRAKQLAPSSSAPFVQDALVKMRLYQLTGEKPRLEEALAAASRATTLGGSSFPAAEARSQVLLAGGDFNGAVAELERFLRIVPTHVEGRRQLVTLLTRGGNPDRAADSIREAIGYAPGEPGWHFALGEVLMQKGDFAGAASSFQRADTLLPSPGSLIRELESRIRARDFRGAIDTGRRRGDAVRANPTARAYIGAALVGAGERAEGARTLGEAYAIAVKSFDEGNPSQLAEWFGPLRFVFSPAQLAEAETMLGQIDGGKRNILTSEFLASLALSSGPGGAPKAIEYLSGADSMDLTAMPTVAVAVYDRLGSAYYFSGQCEKAIASYEKALKIAPGADTLLNNFAYLCGECLKDPKRGMQAARLAVQIQPTRSEYLDTLATLLIADGQPREALDVLARATANGTTATMEYHRAQAMAALGLSREAREVAEKALAMKPDGATKSGLDQLLSTLK